MSVQRLERLIQARSLRTDQALRHLQATRTALEHAREVLAERRAAVAQQRALRVQLLAGVVAHGGARSAETLQRIERRRGHLDERVAQLEQVAAEAAQDHAAASAAQHEALSAWVAARNRQQRLTEHRETVLRAERRRIERRQEQRTDERYSRPQARHSG